MIIKHQINLGTLSLLINILLISTLLTNNAAAQSSRSKAVIISPGSDSVAYKKVRPYKFTYQLILQENGSRTSMGTLTDQLIIPGGSNKIERIQIFQRPNQPDHVDTLRANASTLRPILHSSTNARREILLNFTKQGVQGTYTPASGSTINIKENFDQPYFDSSWVDFIIRLLPLDKGFRAILPIHEVNSNGQSTFPKLELHVSQQIQMQNHRGKPVKAWVIESTKNGRRATFFVQITTHEMLKIEQPLSGEKKIIIERIN